MLLKISTFENLCKLSLYRARIIIKLMGVCAKAFQGWGEPTRLHQPPVRSEQDWGSGITHGAKTYSPACCGYETVGPQQGVDGAVNH